MWVNRYKVELSKQGPVIIPLNDAPATGPVLVDDLFEQVRDANLRAYKVETEYHPYFGFPTNINADWEKDVIDDECFIQVTEFKVLNSNET